MGVVVVRWYPTSSELLSHSAIRPRELLSESAPASCFSILFFLSWFFFSNANAELPLKAPNWGHSNPACGVWWGPPLMSESVLFLPRHPFNSALFPTRHHRHTPSAPAASSRPFVCCGNRHRCSSCLTQGHFPPNRHLVCEQLSPAPSSSPLLLNSLFHTAQPPLVTLFLSRLSPTADRGKTMS